MNGRWCRAWVVLAGWALAGLGTTPLAWGNAWEDGVEGLLGEPVMLDTWGAGDGPGAGLLEEGDVCGPWMRSWLWEDALSAWWPDDVEGPGQEEALEAWWFAVGDLVQQHFEDAWAARCGGPPQQVRRWRLWPRVGVQAWTARMAQPWTQGSEMSGQGRASGRGRQEGGAWLTLQW
jgi:hypothetical protein